MTFVAGDLETHLIQPGLLAPPIVCGSFAKRDGSGNIKGWLTRTPVPEFAAWLSTGHIIAGANIAYDFGCILAAKPELFPLIWRAYEEGRVWDVLISQTLVAISEGRLQDGDLFTRAGTKMLEYGDHGKQKKRYTLANTTWEVLGRSDAKKNDRWRLSYALLENLPTSHWPPDAREYPVDDACNTLEVAEAQAASGFDFSPLKMQAHAAFCAHLSAMWGLRADAERVAPLRTNLEAQIKEISDWAVTKGWIREDGSMDTKAFKEAVTKAYNGKPPTTPKGGVSTARATLEESGDADLERFSKISHLEKLHGYTDVLETATKIPWNVQPNILLSTGRASYEGLIQLMPRKGGIRECIQFRGVGSSVDYSAVELSTLAQVMLWTLGRSRLADAINAGMDPHCIFGAKMTGQTYEAFKAKVDAGDEDAKYQRYAAKAANFGFPGLMGPVGFVRAKRREGDHPCEWFYRDGRCGEEKTTEWRGRPIDDGAFCVRCLEESAKLKQFYAYEVWSDMPDYWAWVKTRLEYTDVAETFVTKMLRGGLSEPAAANHYFQSLAAIGAKHSVIQLTKEMYLDRESPLYGSRLCIFAHDETIIDIPDQGVNFVHDAAHRQATVMVEEMKKVVPDVRVKAEPALMKWWYKAAEPVYVNGRLVPWEPKEKAA